MSIFIGKQAERIAEQFLLKQGMFTLERNYYCKMGEIDLIMLDQDDIVFIEVRHRRSKTYGGALDSITFTKQQKIYRTAEHYIHNRLAQQNDGYRFDVVAFEGNFNNICWIKNAFN